MTTKKEVTVQESKTITTPVDMNEWGDVVVESKDLMLPRLMLQQAVSDMVKERLAKDGDYFNTLTNEIQSVDGKIKVLPFYVRQYFRIEKYNGRKFEFDSIVPYDGKPRPFEEMIGADKFKNLHVYEYFCLTEEGGLPVSLGFKSTSHKTGKRLFNMMYIANKQLNKPPANNWIELGSTTQEKEGDKYKVIDYKTDRVATKEELTECLTWIKTIKETNVAIQEEPTTEQPASNGRF